jgi:hypothetical protein
MSNTLESTEMKKILLSAVVVLVTSAPIAFAAANSAGHCTYNSEKADVCHQDLHKNGGEQSSGASSGRR